MDGANITSEERKRKLALTLCSDLDFDKMKSTFKRLFTTSSNHSHYQDNIVSIKQEEAFSNKKYKKLNDTKNPLDKNGKIWRCIICDSKLHWQKKCPYGISQNINIVEEHFETEECNIVLITENISKQEIFVMEAASSAVIDTACTETVAGEHWFMNYKSYLLENSIKNIKILKTDTKFKFGDGKQVTGPKRVILPARIVGQHC